MSWICEVCSTSNDEKEIECFVCGTARSEASIREGKIRAREEKIRKLEDGIYNKGMFVLKLGLISTVALIVVAIIIKVAQGTLFTDFEENGGFFISTLINNSSGFADAVIRFFSTIILTDKSEFFELYFSSINRSELFSTSCEAIGERLAMNVNLLVNNMGCIFENSDSTLAFEPIMEHASINWEATASVWNGVSASMDERFEFLESFCGVAFERAAVCLTFIGIATSEVIRRINKNTTDLIENVLKVTSKFMR